MHNDGYKSASRSPLTPPALPPLPPFRAVHKGLKKKNWRRPSNAARQLEGTQWRFEGGRWQHMAVGGYQWQLVGSRWRMKGNLQQLEGD